MSKTSFIATFSIAKPTYCTAVIPCCQKALMLHNEYAMKLEKLKKEYTRHYGPLSIFDEVDSWTTWVENPWPWERGAY